MPGFGADPRGDVVTQAGTLTYYTEANNPASRVDINRTVNLQYQQFGAYVEGAHNFNQNLRRHRRCPAGHQHPLQRGAHQPAGRR